VGYKTLSECLPAGKFPFAKDFFTFPETLGAILSSNGRYLGVHYENKIFQQLI
jgi:hypothetical protein